LYFQGPSCVAAPAARSPKWAWGFSSAGPALVRCRTTQRGTSAPALGYSGHARTQDRESSKPTRAQVRSALGNSERSSSKPCTFPG
jgi:hypothetical protein